MFPFPCGKRSSKQIFNKNFLFRLQGENKSVGRKLVECWVNFLGRYKSKKREG